ncbi:phosphonatase-like hydrolase [Mucilaginibacter dorajii]|jgi:phosphonatase-like hydrolase|uniref:Phosphonatase-like hydrolase n=1 Tax=Mucilaginibacter dorajii TaxID=692994 RepID=A0ABP7PYU2_9SPHI|nr:phosphonatase-like hydrolase [Mucilaginibacter dorajii]MCS3736444.1 phosphonatase-like hydrolase [Mucilaginibacter dorajii]
MIKMVVFDMAGTTIDENNVVYKTLQKAINEAGFDFTLDQVLAQGAGKEKFQAIKSILATYADNTDEQLASEIYGKFVVHLRDAYANIEIFPQNNAVTLFDALNEKGVLTVLNTGYNKETAESLIDKLGWEKGHTFDGLVTATDVGKNRPNPDMIWLAMEQFGITDAAEVVKVGDSIIDIEEGQNAGCALSVGITTGAHTKAQLESANPDAIIDDLLELLPLLDK